MNDIEVKRATGFTKSLRDESDGTAPVFPDPLIAGQFLQSASADELINYDLLGGSNTWAGAQTINGALNQNGTATFAGQVNVNDSITFAGANPKLVWFNNWKTQIDSILDITAGASVRGSALEVFAGGSAPSWFTFPSPGAGVLAVEEGLEVIKDVHLVSYPTTPEDFGMRVGGWPSPLGYNAEQDMLQVNNIRTTSAEKRRGITAVIDCGDTNPGGNIGQAHYGINGFVYTEDGTTTGNSVTSGSGGLNGARNSVRHRGDSTLTSVAGVSGVVQIDPQGLTRRGIITHAAALAAEPNDGGDGGVSSPFTGKLTHSYGLRVLNGIGVRTNQVGINIVMQSGGTSSSHGMKVYGGTTTGIWVGADFDPLSGGSLSYGIRFGKATSTAPQLYRVVPHTDGRSMLETNRNFNVGEDLHIQRELWHGMNGTAANRKLGFFLADAGHPSGTPVIQEVAGGGGAGWASVDTTNAVYSNDTWDGGGAGSGVSAAAWSMDDIVYSLKIYGLLA